MTLLMADSPTHPHWLLRHRDQTAVAGLVLVAILAMLGWWFANGGWGGRLTDIDEQKPLPIHFEVDINTAEAPELMQLPGVGQKLAERIIESRQTDGRFESVDDLMRVHGIGRKTMAKLRPYLRVGGENGENADCRPKPPVTE